MVTAAVFGHEFKYAARALLSAQRDTIRQMSIVQKWTKKSALDSET